MKTTITAALAVAAASIALAPIPAAHADTSSEQQYLHDVTTRLQYEGGIRAKSGHESDFNAALLTVGKRVCTLRGQNTDETKIDDRVQDQGFTRDQAVIVREAAIGDLCFLPNGDLRPEYEG
jgi:hypothetical protein